MPLRRILRYLPTLLLAAAVALMIVSMPMTIQIAGCLVLLASLGAAWLGDRWAGMAAAVIGASAMLVAALRTTSADPTPALTIIALLLVAAVALSLLIGRRPAAEYSDESSEESAGESNVGFLSASGDRLARIVMDRTGDGVFITDGSGMFLSANRAALDMLGYALPELVGRNSAELFADDDRLREPMRLPDADGAPMATLRRLRRKDGRIITVEGDGIRLEDGRLVGIWHDVSALSAAHEAVSSIRSKFEAVGAAVDGLVYEWNPSTRIAMRSHGLSEHFGYPPEMVDSTIDWWADRIHPEDRPETDRIVRDAVAAGSGFSLEYRFRAGDGQYRYVTDRAVVLRDRNGAATAVVGCVLDVDEQRRSELALAASDARFRQLADAMPIFVWTARPDGSFEFFNRRWSEYSGLSVEAASPDMRATLHPDDLDQCAQAWFSSIRTGAPYQMECRYRDASTGAYRWHLARAVPARDSEGRVIRWYGTGTDIDDVKQAQTRLKQQLDLIRTITDNAADSLFLMDPDGNLTFMNPAAERTFGWRQEEILGRRLHDVVHYRHPDGRPYPMIDCPLGSVFKTGQTITGHEDVFYHCDGSPIDVVCSNAVIVLDGKITGAVLMVQDNRARKNAERERAEALSRERSARMDAERAQRRSSLLAEAGEIFSTMPGEVEGVETLVRHLVSSFADGAVVVTLDEHGAPSPAAIADADRTREERFRDLIGLLLNGHDGRPGILGNVVEERESCLVDREHLAGLRESLPFGARALMDKLAPGSCIVVPIVARDQTHGALLLVRGLGKEPFSHEDMTLAFDLARRAGAAVDNARLIDAIQQANAAKDRFLAVLSHELRTPLTPVVASIHALADESLPEDLRPLVEIIQRNIELETRLIDDLLDLTRIINGKLALADDRVEIVELIRSVLDICRHDMGERDLLLIVDLAAGRSVLNGDAARLRQVLWNLLKNAIKFSHEGGTITIATRNVEDRIEIEVSDRGVGIAPEQLARIFEAFEQGPADTHRRYGGLGLGLAISRSIVQMHGGRIEARSAGAEQGATFIVSLAAAEPDPEVPATDDPGEVRSIFVLDTPTDTVSIARLLIDRSGRRITIAHSLRAALRGIAGESPDLLLIDIDANPDAGELMALAPEASILLVGTTPSMAGLMPIPEGIDYQFLARPVGAGRLQEAIEPVLG